MDIYILLGISFTTYFILFILSPLKEIFAKITIPTVSDLKKNTIRWCYEEYMREGLSQEQIDIFDRVIEDPFSGMPNEELPTKKKIGFVIGILGRRLVKLLEIILEVAVTLIPFFVQLSHGFWYGLVAFGIVGILFSIYYTYLIEKDHDMEFELSLGVATLVTYWLTQINYLVLAVWSLL